MTHHAHDAIRHNRKLAFDVLRFAQDEYDRRSAVLGRPLTDDEARHLVDQIFDALDRVIIRPRKDNRHE